MHDDCDPFRAPARESMGPRKLEVARVRITDEAGIGGGNRMTRNARGRLMALCLLLCAVVMIGLALSGVLQLRATRTPVAVVAK